MNVTSTAPRLSASMPSAPVPAKASRTRAPWIRGMRTLNSVSRSLSDVGRNPSHAGDFSRRPFSDPAMMRMLGSSDLDQFESRLPVLEQARHRRRRGGLGFEPLIRFALRELEHRMVPHQI